MARKTARSSRVMITRALSKKVLASASPLIFGARLQAKPEPARTAAATTAAEIAKDLA
jgi:hypothetical protein